MVSSLLLLSSQMILTAILLSQSVQPKQVRLCRVTVETKR
jgi:hypothetical protein